MKNFATGSENESVQDRKKETGTCMENCVYLLYDDKECECLLNDDNEVLMQTSKRDCVENFTDVKNERG